MCELFSLSYVWARVTRNVQQIVCEKEKRYREHVGRDPVPGVKSNFPSSNLPGISAKGLQLHALYKTVGIHLEGRSSSLRALDKSSSTKHHFPTLPQYCTHFYTCRRRFRRGEDVKYHIDSIRQLIPADYDSVSPSSVKCIPPKSISTCLHSVGFTLF
jgi:hypothetical protein